MDAEEIERALHAILPTASPQVLMEAVVKHTIAVSKSDPMRKRRRAKRRHGAFARKREQDQSREYNLQLDVIDLRRQIAQLEQLRDMVVARQQYSDESEETMTECVPTSPDSMESMASPESEVSLELESVESASYILQTLKLATPFTPR